VRRLLKLLLSTGLALILGACQIQPSKLLVTAKYVDLIRYQGVWYEIAAFPNRFQKNCQCTTARYTLIKNQIRVMNQCYRNKAWSKIRGIAWVVDKKSQSKLKVRFFWPLTGNYWILYVSNDYRYALVTTPDRNYLWILARKAIISAFEYQKLVAIAASAGLNVHRLKKTAQDCYTANSKP
jgi:apolipoprotein D and lipocalin family protein